jgi:hypothetical protein
MNSDSNKFKQIQTNSNGEKVQTAHAEKLLRNIPIAQPVQHE